MIDVIIIQNQNNFYSYMHKKHPFYYLHIQTSAGLYSRMDYAQKTYFFIGFLLLHMLKHVCHNTLHPMRNLLP